MSRRVARSNWDYRSAAPSLARSDKSLQNVWTHQTRCATWVSSHLRHFLRHVTVSGNWAYGFQCSGPRYEQHQLV